MPYSSYLSSKKFNFIKVSLLSFLLVVIAILYFPGTNGSFYYDDIRPLSGLANITDIKSSLVYISNESSGPLGRPIAMFSFLANINDWPTDISTGDKRNFFIFNVILHCINGLLVFLLSSLIAKLYLGENKTNYWLAIATSAFWLVLPIHVSTSLIAIQRMAGLSAFFVFSGLLLYTYGLYKQSIENTHNINNNHGLTLQLMGLILFTLLAMLTKENGVLLPVFALVLEVTLLAKLPTIKFRRKLRISASTLGLITLLLYLAYIVFQKGNVLPGREFSLAERLLTEPQILVDYLYLAFIPDITAFNPFHDNYQYVSDLWGSNKAFFSILLVTCLLSSALYYRKKYPLFSFAVLWFLTAHLIESTVIDLELYFEHRNYIALFGPCLALVFTFTKMNKRYQTLAIISFSIYWLLMCICLLITTQLWGKPVIAAKTWQAKQIGSSRATAYLSNIYLQQGNIAPVPNIVKEHIKVCKDCAGSQAVALFFSCYLNNKQSTRDAYNALMRLSHTTKDSRGVPANLEQVRQLIVNNSCQYLTLPELKALNTAYLGLPNTPFNKKLLFLQNLYAFTLHEKNKEESIRILYLAWEAQTDDMIGNELVMMLVASQRIKEAESFIENKICRRTSSNPVLAKVKKDQCSYLSKEIKKHTIK